jgi:4-amino-4-deoxy-L-arabinose transferase-like glycosyltransferase
MNPIYRNGWGLTVAATVAVAAILRAYGLNSGLWFDEIVTLVESARRPLIEILNYFPDVNVHPFYSLLAHASLQTFGESAWALRLPACIFGVASIWMTYVLGARLISRAEAWAGAAVLTVSYQHVWFSQNARGYTMMGFFALLSTHFLLRALESRRASDYAFYALTCAAGIYTHLTMVFVVAGHVAVIAGSMLMGWKVTREEAFKPMVMALGVAGILTLALYAPYASELLSHFDREGPKQAAQFATGRWAVIELLRNIVSGSGILGAAITALAALIGALSLLRRQPLALALLVVPALVAGAALVVLGQPIRPRFFFFLAGAVGIFAGRGVGAVADRLARPRHSLAFIIGGTALLVTFSAVGLRLNYRVPKQDFDGAVRYLEGQAAGGTIVAAADPACFPIERYYLKTDWPCLRTVDDLRAVLATSQPVLVLYTLSDHIEAGLRDRLRGTCAESRRFPGTLGDGDVIVCDPRKRAGKP